MAYVWRDSNSKIPAQVVGERIEALERQYGVCHPKLIVQDARPLTSPLHGLFEWDDTLAAEQYRVEQARGVIQAIRIINVQGDAPRIAFVHVRTEDAGLGYATVLRAMSNKAMRQQVLRDCLGQLTALEKRYAELSELRSVWKAVRVVRAKAGTKKPKTLVPA